MDWSSKDWDGKKAKAREQCPLLDFNVLEMQIQKTLQDRAQDIPQDMMHDITTDKQETDLVNGIQDLMLEPKLDVQNSTDLLAPPPDVSEVKSKGEDETNRPTMTLIYEMMAQKIQIQKEVEKYGIYMSTSGYEGDDSDLDSKTESESDATAYLYLG